MGVVRVGPRQLVDERAVQVHLSLVVDGQAAEVGLHLGQRTVDVRARVLGIVRLPHRDGRTPVTVTADGPVAGVVQPLAELAVLDVARDPVDLLVQLGHAVLELGDLHVPGRYRAVDQRVPAAPAVRVAVLVAGLADQAAIGAEHLGDGLVGVEDLQAHDRRQFTVCKQGQELGALIHGEDHGDAGVFTDLLVILTVGRSLVNDAGTVSGGDVIGHQESPGVFRAVLLGIGKVIPQRFVLEARQLGTRVSGHNSGSCGSGVVVPQVLGIGPQQVSREQEAARHRSLSGCRLHAVGSCGQDGIGDVRPDGERQVGGQRPGRGGPGERLHAFQRRGECGVSGLDGERDRDGLVLAVLVDVVVHAEFVVGQRRLVLPAVRKDTVAVVGEALLMKLLEGPEYGLHVLDVEGLVVVLEVNPTGLAGDVGLPLVGVLHDGGTAGVIELIDAHGFDLRLVRHAQLLHGFELCRQSVRVPAEAALHSLAALGLVAAYQVLGVAGQQVAVVREAVGEGRAIVEDEFVASVRARIALVDAGLEGAVFIPVFEDALFDFRELHGSGHAVRAGRRR